jgi:hypothetical protein
MASTLFIGKHCRREHLSVFFVDFHNEKNEFTKEQVQSFVKRKCSETTNPNMYNENTIGRDIEVLFKNYITPSSNKPNEDLLSLMTGLNLIRIIDKKIIALILSVNKNNS